MGQANARAVGQGQCYGVHVFGCLALLPERQLCRGIPQQGCSDLGEPVPEGICKLWTVSAAGEEHKGWLQRAPSILAP